jgi:hypothetical protein
MEESQRVIIANMSLCATHNVLNSILEEKISNQPALREEFMNNQAELVPVLVDEYECYKMAQKHNTSQCQQIEQLLFKLYFVINTEAINRVILHSF